MELSKWGYHGYKNSATGRSPSGAVPWDKRERRRCDLLWLGTPEQQSSRVRRWKGWQLADGNPSEDGGGVKQDTTALEWWF